MFEKEEINEKACEHCNEVMCSVCEHKICVDTHLATLKCREWRDRRAGFYCGAEFGYNKANEWHNINDIEPSKEQFGKQLLIRIESVIGDTDYDYLVYKYKGESISDIAGVIAWKEIK